MTTKMLQEVITRYGHTYRRAGSFTSKLLAESYKEQALYSLLVIHDNPKQFGVGVKYHVFRRED